MSYSSVTRGDFPPFSSAYGGVAVCGNLEARNPIRNLPRLLRAVSGFHDDLQVCGVGRFVDRTEIDQKSIEPSRAVWDERDSFVLVAGRVTENFRASGALWHRDRLPVCVGLPHDNAILPSFAGR